MIKLKSKKTRMGIMLFLVPALVIYLVFQIIPIIGPYQLDELQESLNSSTLTLQKETIEWLLT